MSIKPRQPSQSVEPGSDPACYLVVFGDGVVLVDGQGLEEVEVGSCDVVGGAVLVVLVVEAGAVVDVWTSGRSVAVVEAVVVVVVDARLDVVDAGVALVLDGELMAVVDGHRVVATTLVVDDVVVEDAEWVVDVVEAGATGTSRTGSGGSGRTAM